MLYVNDLLTATRLVATCSAPPLAFNISKKFRRVFHLTRCLRVLRDERALVRARRVSSVNVYDEHAFCFSPRELEATLRVPRDGHCPSIIIVYCIDGYLILLNIGLDITRGTIRLYICVALTRVQSSLAL
jgi:hypothetical protein